MSIGEAYVATQLILWGAIVISGVACAVKRKPRNRYRKVLPPPSPLCERSADWRAHVSR